MRLLKTIQNLLISYGHQCLTGILIFLFSCSIFANPILDNVAAGQVTIQQAPNSTVINQGSQKAIINWQSFNIGAQESTHFQQPAGGIALNRINPSQGVSEIYGRLTATGQIILVNPAGIFFGPGSYVNVGGLIASTANISNEDFLNHYYHFANVQGYNGAIVNQGQIIAANNGLIALIGGAVSNEGLIQAHVGHAVLASGNSFTMSFAGNDLIGFSVDSAATQRAIDKNGNELSVGVNNTGSVIADGGHILISAKSAAGILDNVINMNGIAQARSVIDGANPRDGEIIILGDADRGVVNVGGVLDASSDSDLPAGSIIVKAYDLSVDNGASFNVSSTAGDGGFIDTSGMHGLHLGNLTINTAAPNGKAGTWLIDPADINITTVDANITGASPFTATAAGATLNVAILLAALANGDVIVRTTNDGFAGSGNITVSSAITWSSSYNLTLEAFNNIIINAGISGINGTLSLTAVNAAASITTGASGTIDVGNFNLTQGQWLQVGTLPSFNVRNSFSLAGDAAFGGTSSPARFLRAAGGDGNSTGTAYQLVDIYGIQGINSGSIFSDLLTKYYILANNIDATGTATWNNNQGFHPIGYFYATGAGNEFNGNFNGNNKVINGLTINRSQTDIGCCGDMGSALFAVTWHPSIYNLGLTNVNITSQNNRAAGLVAFASWQANPGWGGGSGGSFYNNYVTGNVTSYGSQAGGLFGYVGSGNTVNSSYSAATVTSINSSAPAGGLIAYLSSGSTVTNSYSTGTVRALGANASAGGFVGTAETATTITNAYSSGLVHSTNGNSGGFIGTRNAGSTVNNGFWDTDTSLQSVGVGSGSTAGVTGGCFGGVCTNGGTANLALASTYTGWTIANSGFNVATAPGSLGAWLILDNQTRPMLWSEWNTSISNAHQLQLMSTALSANYSLAKNIDLSSGLTNTSDVWNTNYNTPTGAGFVPVGTVANGYTGNFNGNNFVIDRLYIQRANLALGLFGATTDTSTISNIGVTNISITQLAGSNVSVGGLAGRVAGDVTNAYTTGNVSSLSNETGGLIGYVNSGGTTATISNSYSTANVTSTGSYTGGLIGDTETYAEVLRSYASGNVTGTTHVGGLIGFNNGYPTQDVYATGNVTGTDHVGGLVGRQYSSLNRGYSTGLVNNGVIGTNVGGFMGSTSALIGSGWFVTDSLWDSVTSGQTKGVGDYSNVNGPTAVTLYAGCFAAGGTCATQNISNATLTGSITPKDLTLVSTYTSGGPTWNITKTPSTNSTPPNTTWYIFDASKVGIYDATASSYTRPILMMEYQTNITNAHGLQLMGSTLGGNFTLANDLDLTNAFNNASEIWGTNRNTATGYGFVAAGYAWQGNSNPSPVTQFVGTFDGNNHTISNLYVNKPHFGDTDSGGLFIETGTGASISNLVLMNASVTGASQGYASQGGLVGVMRGGSISNVSFYGTVSGSGGSVGGLVGIIDSGTNTVSNSSFNGTVYGNWILSVGGLVGAMNNGTISNSYSTGSVIRTDPRISNIGGLVGGNAGTISNSYSLSSVSGGPVSAGTTTGGLIGSNSGTINNSYSTGSVTSTNTYGGFIGDNVGTVNSSVWDTVTSGQPLAIGAGSSTGIVGMTTSQMMTLANFTTPANGFVTSAWNITNTPSTTSIAPSNTWFIFAPNSGVGDTRPMLMMEKNNTIRGAHQLQMMGSALGGIYTLANNIDLSSSLNATNSAADVWGTRSSTVTGSGFYPIASGTNFTGSFNGQNFTLSNFYINRSSTLVGLFSSTSQLASIKNLGLTSGSITGSTNTGGIAGYNAGVISNVYNSGANVTGGYNTGGLVGYSSSTSVIISTHNTGNIIFAQSEAGGIVGHNIGVIADSWNSGNAHPAGGLYYAGGIAGTNWGTIQTSYNIGHITSQSYGGGIGGIAGGNVGTIIASYNTGYINGTNAGQETGGLVGRNYGSVTNSYNLGKVEGTSVPTSFPYIGGLVGWNTSGGTITNSYNAGYVTGAYGPYFGGIIGYHDGSAPAPITRSFWDTATSGQSAVLGVGSLGSSTYTGGCFGSASCTNGGTVDLTLLATFSAAPNNWNTTSMWAILENNSYPYLKYFYNTTPRAITATSSAAGNTTNIAVGGVNLDTSYTGANGFVYFLEGNNTLGVNNTIANLTPILLYFSGAATKSNALTLAPASGASLTGSSGLVLTNNTFTTGNNGTSLPLNITSLSTAKGSLSGADILFSIAGNNLSVTSGNGFASTSGTTLNLLGNSSITTTGAGSINILGPVAGGGFTFTVSSDSASNTISGVMSNLSGFTKAGSGTLILPVANSFTAGVTLSAGTLSIGNNAALGTSTNILTDNGGTLTASTTGINIPNPIVLTADSTFRGTNNFTLSGDISGNFALIKSDGNVLSLRGTNSFVRGPALIINGGTVNITSDAQIGGIIGSPDPDNITIGGGGILQIDNPGNTVTLNSDRGITLTSGGGVLQTTATTNLTYNGIIAGAFGLTFDGPGSFTIGSSITAPASITANANINAFNFGGTALTSTAGVLNLSSTNTFTNSGTVTLTSSAGSNMTLGAITWSGSNALNLSSGNDIILNGAISGTSGSFNISAGTASNTITTGSGGTVNVNNFNLTRGQWYQNTASLPEFNVGNNFQITGTSSPATSTSQFIRATSGNGAGTPYVLVDVYGLQGIGSNAATITQNFNLGNDIDASSTIRWNSGAGFVPIALTSIYSGIFNGLNNSISNLYINLPNTNNVGLFSSTNISPSGPAMSNLSVVNANVTGSSYVGILTGFSANQISNVFVSGNVNSFTDNATDIGGMVGRLHQPFNPGTISNSGSNVNVNVYGNNVTNIGGIAGYSYAGYIQDSYSIGNIMLTQSGANIGGIAGQIYVRNYQNNYAGGNITILGAGTKVGGAFGISNGTTLTNIYSTTNISVGANSYGVGGFIGHWFTGNSINQSYSSGLVTAGSGSTGVGGFAGLYDAMTINNSYWDIGSSGRTAGFGASSGYSGGYTITNFNGGCFGNTSCNASAITNASNASGTPIDLSLSASYTGFTFDATSTRSGNTSPGSNWVMINGSTRPMLSSEWSLNIRTPHQVQLMDFALGGSYSLKTNVDFYNGMRNAGEVWGTNVNTATGAGFLGVGNQTNTFTGSLNGNGYAINNLYINFVTATTTQKAGLFGSTTNASISNIGVSDANITLSGPGSIGILVGNMSGGSITNAYTSGSITLNGTVASLGVGGLVGNSSGNYTITNTYSTANVRATDGLSIAGGLIGLIGSGTITVGNSYSSGEVLGTNAAGFIGSASGGTYTFNNNFWDTQTSGQPSSVGATGISTNQMKTMSTFTGGGWSTTAGVAGSITSTASSTSTAPNYTWFIFDGLTRPMLMTENSNSVSNSHQVQMMGAALGKNYSLSNNVYAAADMDNLSEVWGSKSSTASGSGYVPISNYSGVVNGNKFAIDGLYIRGYTQHGLFASTTSTAYIMNLGITGGSVTGGSYVAGLVGLNAGRILNSYNTSTLNASGSYLNYMGGIAGYNTGVITNSYNSGSIGTLADGGAFGTVGGVAGYNAGQISTSYNTGTINGLTGFNGHFGGVVGTNDTSGTITNSFNAGVVSASNSINATGFGGFVGNNIGTISNSLSYGYVAIPGGSNFTAGFAGINTGTITGSLWNTDTSGRASAVGSGTSTGMTGGCFTGTCTNGGTANLASNVSPTTYTTAGWDMTNVWNVIEDKSYPYLRAFSTSTPRVVAGSSPASAGNTVNLAVNGAVLDTVTAGANGEFYFFAGYNNISGVNRAITDNSPALIYLTSGASVSNAVVLTPASTGSLSGTTSLTLTASTVTAGNNSTSGALSNSLLRTALGSLSGSNILYAVDGSNNLTLNSGRNFQTSPTTAYTIDGNIAATGANIIFNTAATIGSSNPVISTTTSGNITFGSTVTGGGNPFTVSNPTSTTATFNGVISGSGTSLTKLGAGALTLSSTSNSFTGGLFLNGGTLTTASLPSAAGNSIIGTGNLFINNGATLSYTGTTAIFNRPITINSGGGTIQSNNSSAHNLIITGGITVNGGLTFDTIGSGPTSISLLSTTLSGSGSITKTGSGTLTFGANNNSYNGTITVSDGTLQVGTGNSTGTLGVGNVINNAALVFNRNDLFSVPNIISGTGSLTQTGLGTLALSGSNSYTGSTSIISGVLSINTIGDAGMNTSIGNSSSAINISFGTTLRYTGAGDSSSRQIALGTGGGTLDASGSGLLTLSGGVIGTNTDLVLTGTSAGTQSGEIATGTGTLTKTGAGTWTLSGASTYTGATSITAGTLSINTIGNSGTNTAIGNSSASITISGGGTLQYTGAVASSLRPIVLSTGGGNLDASGSGLLTLSGGVTGATFNLGLIGSGTGTLSGIIGTTSGGLTKNGSGTWTLTNVANTYTGATSITGGTLSVSSLANGGSNSSLGATIASTAINISGDGILSYTGGATSTNRQFAFSGTGGTIQTTTATATTLSGTINNAGTTLTFNPTSSLGSIIAAGAISGAGSLTKAGAGGLTLSAANSYTGATLINNGTLVASNAASLGSGATQSISTTIAPGATLSLQTLLSNSNLISLSGTGNGGLSALVNTTFAQRTLNNPLLLMGNTTIGGSFGELILNGNISENVVGSILTKTGTSTVYFRGTNSYTGATQVNQGILAITNANGLGSGVTQSNGINVANGASLYIDAPITLNNTSMITIAGTGLAPSLGALTFATNGTVILNNPITLASNISIGVANGGGSDHLVLNGDITGAFSITKEGLIALDLNGNNTYSGGTIINGSSFGRIEVGNPSGLGTGTISMNNGGLLVLELNNAALANTNTISVSSGAGYLIHNGTGTVTVNNPIVLASGTALSINALPAASDFVIGNNITNNNSSINVNDYSLLGSVNGNVTISGVIGNGSGSLTKARAGTTLTLSNNNTYTGTTFISGGTLQIGNGGTTGTLGSGAVTNNGALSFNRSDSYTVGNAIGGTGTLTQSGTGTVILANDNNYSGPTTISSGILQIGNGGTTGTLGTNSVTNNAGLSFNRSNSYTVSNAISGTGTLAQSGSGTVIITNDNNYSGITTISNGILQIGNGGTTGTLGTNSVTNNAELLFNRSNSYTVSNAIGGTGTLTQSGSGTVILANDNNYSGITSINSGILQIGNGGTTGSLGSGTVTNNSALIVNRSNDITIANLINGSGTLTKNGAGMLSITNANSYTGLTTMNAGTLSVGNNTALGTNTLTINAGTLQTEINGVTLGNAIILGGTSFISNNGLSFTLDGAVNGAQALSLTGAGTTQFNAAIGDSTALTSLTAGTDIIVTGGVINTTGDQLYNNDVTLGNHATFTNDGIGSQNISFNGTLDTGTSNLILSGANNAGSYQFTINDINATSSTITVNAAALSTNNSLVLNTGGTQDFVLTASKTGVVNNITNVNFNFNNILNLNGGGGGFNSLTGANTTNTWNIAAINGGNIQDTTNPSDVFSNFVNMQSLNGGTDLDIFDFSASGSISGIVDGGDSANINQINFTTAAPITLLLSMPIASIIDAGVLFNNNVQIANFTQVQQSFGNGTGSITLPNEPSITVTYYDSTFLNGEIADPFYFNNWIIGNPPPTPTPTPSGNPSPYIAPIVNQPMVNAASNGGTGSPINYGVVNQTFITPLLGGSTVTTGAACYTNNIH